MKIFLLLRGTGRDLSRLPGVRWLYSVGPYSNYLVQVCCHVSISSQYVTISLALASAVLSIDPIFRLQAFWFECVLRENGLAIMPMTTSKVSSAALHLLAIACIMLVAVQMTEAARELEDGVRGVLLNRE